MCCGGRRAGGRLGLPMPSYIDFTTVPYWSHLLCGCGVICHFSKMNYFVGVALGSYLPVVLLDFCECLSCGTCGTALEGLGPRPSRLLSCWAAANNEHTSADVT